MYLSRLSNLLFVALSFALVAKAISPDVHRPAPTGAVGRRQIFSMGDDEDDEKTTTTVKSKPKPTGAVGRRQILGIGDDEDDEKTTTTEESKPETTKEDPKPTTTTDKKEEETTKKEETTKEDPKPTTTTTAKEEETKTDDKTETTEDPAKDDNNDEDTPVAEPTTRTKVITTVDAEGKPTSITTKETLAPGLSDEDSGSSEGMSKETRNIVIGVVVGVGGAIIIGVLAFVLLRIRNRKRAAEAPDSYATMQPMDKPDSPHAPSGGHMATGPRNPFQSTLETYHAPTHVNASSNF